MYKKISIFFTLIFSLFIVSCGGDTDEAKVQSINIVQDEIILNIGSSETIELDFKPNDTTCDIIWDVENFSVATVENNVVTAHSIGQTTITVFCSYDNSIKDSVVIKVVKREFDIQYQLNGGEFGYDVQTKFEEGTGLSELPVPTKDSHIFDGWYLDGELTTEIPSSYNKNVILVAKWIEIIPKEIYQITYELNGGKFLIDVPSTYEEGTGLSELASPVKPNHIFDGWYLGEEIITSIPETQKGNVTLVAKWIYLESASIETATKIINMINVLPYNTSYNDKNDIEYISNLYNQLDAETQALITNYDVLLNKLEVINAIEANVSEITYVLGDNIYLNREELFNNFFSDFYNYIITYHGSEYLEEKGIMNITDFLNLASDYNAGNGQMREIGNIASRYMLVKDLNGILANQPETAFFGYCYKNNLYVDLLPFFIRFFAYWRIDEKYANSSNYGADTFAEGWAPTVDIAKFFYYDSETTYVKSDRMLDCFNNTSNVVYGNLPTELHKDMILPTGLKLRGYIFAGWYDNPNFEGKPIVKIEDISKKVILYAKWIKDDEQQQKDLAELVDIYIYNLTTKPADACRRTVQYVRDMYDELSDYGKSLVYNYSTLLEYETKYAEELLNPVTVTINAQFDSSVDLDFIKNQFMLDFNGVTNSNVTKFDVFISKHYSYMDEVGEFFADSAMMGKWGYLLDLLITDNSFRGLKIQVERIKKQESGDLEYVTKALGNLLLSNDASSDSEILENYSTTQIKEDLVNKFGKFEITFKTAINMPEIIIYGYTLVGYYDSNNNLVTKVSENMPTNLTAVYKKN